METFQNFLKLFNPIKSVFSLYLLFYTLPMFIPILITNSIYESIMIDNSLNMPIAIVVGICAFLGFAWSIFFLIYFTIQRNSNPALYQKGFMSEFSVEGGNDE